jgi:hypothetical protein
VNCRSETAIGEKDPVETVLVLYDLHLAAELLSDQVLEPLVLMRVLGKSLEEAVTVVCGVIKVKLKGILACLLRPGLEKYCDV